MRTIVDGQDRAMHRRDTDDTDHRPYRQIEVFVPAYETILDFNDPRLPAHSLRPTQSGNIPMPGHKAVKPRLSSSILTISTFNMSPTFDPRTSIGPVAPLTNGKVTSASVNCCPRWRIVPSLALIAHSTTKVSPGSTLATNRSSLESAYLMLPALLTR